MRRVLGLAMLMLLIVPTMAQGCTISASDVLFGTYNPAANTNSTSGAVIISRATGSAACSYAIGLNTGLNGSVNTRSMANGGSRLTYQLFTDSTYSTPWGGTTTVFGGPPPNGGSDTHTIFAQLLAGQYPVAGAYTDLVTATLYGQVTGTVSVNVKVTIATTCNISATTLAFGVYTGAVAYAPATLSVTCTNTLPYYINLGNGMHADGAFYPRMIGPGGALLTYKLYQNASHSIEWRNTYKLDGQAGTGTGANQTLTVYGVTAAGQSSPPGLYTDTVVVTVTY